MIITDLTTTTPTYRKENKMITLKNIDAVRALEALKTYFPGYQPTLDCFWNTLTIKNHRTAHRWNLIGEEWVYVGEIPLDQTSKTITQFKADQRKIPLGHWDSNC